MIKHSRVARIYFFAVFCCFQVLELDLLKTGGLASPLKIMRTGPAHRRDIDSYQMHYLSTTTIIVDSLIKAKVVGLSC